MTTITVETYDEQEAYWEALADALIDTSMQHAYDESNIPDIDCTGDPLDDEPQYIRDLRSVANDAEIGYECMCGQRLTYGDWVDGSDTLYDCPVCGTRHNLDEQAIDCTGDPEDDEPDEARDVTGWIDGKEAYR